MASDDESRAADQNDEGIDDLGDDPSIADEEVVWRRVPPEYWPCEADGSYLAKSIQSWAFSDSSEPPSPMSVDLASIAEDPETVRRDYPQCGVVALAVVALRAAGFGVRRARVAGNDAHAYVIGDKRSSSRRRRLKKCASIVLVPRPGSPDG